MKGLYVAERRPERAIAHWWGLRSIKDGRWLPVFYNSQAEAEAAATAIG